MPEPLIHPRSPPPSTSNKVHKKQSTPKAKGAVRAKSGCYTCRIRRKKCDEQPDPDGNCQTCVRLRLECLGFGAKRPDWMREGNSVGELRDRIKTFLASQGMIKGHSGGVASSRHSDADHPVLTLSTDTASHIGSSPPPRLGSHSPSGGGNGFPPSYERDHRDPHGHAHPRFVVGDGEDDVVRHDLLHSHSHPRLHHRTYMFTPPASDAPLFDISDGYEYCSTASASSAYRASSASAHFTPQQLSPDSPTHRMISTDVMLPQYPNPLMNNVLLSTNMSPSPWNRNHLGAANAHGNGGGGGGAGGDAYMLSRASFPGAHQTQQQQQQLYQPDFPPVTMYSKFSPLYHAHFDHDDVPPQIEEEDAQMADVDGGAGEAALVHSASALSSSLSSLSFLPFTANQTSFYLSPQAYATLAFTTPTDPLFVDRQDGRLYTHYMQHVLPAMYLLADRSIDGFIRQLADVNDAVRNAMCFVASAHWRSKQIGNGSGGTSPRSTSTGSPDPSPSLLVTDDSDETTTYRQSTHDLLQMTRDSGTLTEGEALAGLMSVSSFLFAGGRGAWQWFLDVACEYVRRTLDPLPHPRVAADGLNASLAEVLRGSSESVRFIVRATMWFEVLASVTEVRKPRFMDVYRELFNDARFAVVDDVLMGDEGANGQTDASGSSSDAPSTARGFSMLSIMGCDNRTFLAIAEISAFAAWKEEELRRGRLSVPELVLLGKQLEEQFFGREREGEGEGGEVFGSGETSQKMRRSHTARIFRASAKLYLHTIVSDDQPLCTEIEDGVQDVIQALQRCPLLSDPTSDAAGSIVRSVVFPICIAGSMTDKREQQTYLSSLLEGQSEAGNCAEVLKAMREVWAERRRRRAAQPESGRAAPMVSWRDVVQTNGLLLLV